jgi:hypothetical protein
MQNWKALILQNMRNFHATNILLGRKVQPMTICQELMIAWLFLNNTYNICANNHNYYVL